MDAAMCRAAEAKGELITLEISMGRDPSNLGDIEVT